MRTLIALIPCFICLAANVFWLSQDARLYFTGFSSMKQRGKSDALKHSLMLAFAVFAIFVIVWWH